MSASMRVRVPPVAPRALEVMETEWVEQLVWQALFGDGSRSLMDPAEVLSSTDEGMTGGTILKAKGTGRHFLDGALAAMQATPRKHGDTTTEAVADLRAFLAALDEHGALLITMER